MSLPNDYKARKALPVCTGVLDYFPDAIAAIAEVSRIGNEQHNPGEPLHWAREKSNDHPDCAVRHIMQRGTRDTDGARHLAKAAWRVMAMLQLEIEAEQEQPATLVLDQLPAIEGHDGPLRAIPRQEGESWNDYFVRMAEHPTGGWEPFNPDSPIA